MQYAVTASSVCPQEAHGSYKFEYYILALVADGVKEEHWLLRCAIRLMFMVNACRDDAHGDGRHRNQENPRHSLYLNVGRF